MAQLSTFVSEVDHVKERHMIDMARMISELQDVKKIVNATLKRCQCIRNQYITELFGDSPPPESDDSDDGNDSDDGDDSDEGNGKDGKDQGNDSKDYEGNERKAKRQKLK